ncbi:dienelactone hydrolase family protein [Bacillus sp. S/N-304-OC-R1]|uniref:dienelactone hydrolase family protein n=1 Tax=Bacillus sp. S/N-304-OC-R1 TaxID=2758034 RepID=UPI001C8DAAAC|nr:dienelactone hydrolase family protein [Bacillus sp. S/N-304-OC-R1]MBY0124282.1 dienelactone hydrolase family protein [Bacillus sp. S/N-304-OC-R1]
MISHINQSDTIIIVIHEIYGINDNINKVCQSLSEQGYDVICPNLIEREKSFQYHEEELAYRHFMDHVGFAKGVAKINSLLLDLKDTDKKIFIVGYSIGATIAWICGREKNVSGVACFYGSRIRDYRNTIPKCPSILFFPHTEPSFHVEELISKLKQHQSIEIHRYEGLHGFSDSFSSRYNEQSAKESFSRLIDFVERNRNK